MIPQGGPRLGGWRVRSASMVKGLVKRLPGVRGLANLLGLSGEPGDPRVFLLKMLPARSVGAEIGVHKGDFSAQILRTVRPHTLHLIDPWQYEPSEAYEQAWYGGK